MKTGLDFLRELILVKMRVEAENVSIRYSYEVKKPAGMAEYLKK